MDILKLDNIKVYFPFFCGKDGKPYSLLTQGEWVAAYLLVCDLLVFPPREFLFKANIDDNLHALTKSRLLTHLLASGQFVTASTQSTIRDVKDLIEYYRPEITTAASLDFQIYTRDENFQRVVYTDHVKEHISFAKYYSDEDKASLIEFFSTRPNHIQIMSKISELGSCLTSPALERLKFEAYDGYFLAGAVGNGAIMPPSRHGERSLLYNQFYSKEAVSCFKKQIEEAWKRPITAINPSDFDKTRTALVPFRYKYKKFSEKYQQHYLEILNLFNKSGVSVDNPLILSYSTAATALASVLAMVITRDVLQSMTGVFLARFTWNYANKALKITDNLSASIVTRLESMGILAPYRKDVVSILAELRSAVDTICKDTA
jgi:hypothetical protein